MSDNDELTPEQRKIKKFLWWIIFGLLIWGGISLWQNDKTFLSIFVFFIATGVAHNNIKGDY